MLVQCTYLSIYLNFSFRVASNMGAIFFANLTRKSVEPLWNHQPPEAPSEAPTLAGPNFAPWPSSVSLVVSKNHSSQSVISLPVSST